MGRVKLGQIVNQAAIKDSGVSVAMEEFPLSSFMSGNVRFRDNSAIDSLEDYIKSFEDTLDRYASSKGCNEGHLKKKRGELVKLRSIASRLRKDKIELWLHVMPYVREYVRQYGEVGTIIVTMPINHAIDKVMFLDFVADRMVVSTMANDGGKV